MVLRRGRSARTRPDPGALDDPIGVEVDLDPSREIVGREVAPAVRGEQLGHVGAVARVLRPKLRLDVGEDVEGHAERQGPRDTDVHAVKRLARAAQRRPHRGRHEPVEQGAVLQGPQGRKRTGNWTGTPEAVDSTSPVSI